MAERGVIKNVMSFGLEVALPDGRTGYVHMADIADWPDDPRQRDSRFSVGEWITVDVTSTDGVALGLRPTEIESLSPDAGPPAPDAAASNGVAGGESLDDELPPDDPDPFSETALDPGERRAMLEKLAEHMRPFVAEASAEQRDELETLWTDLRRQATIERFRACAERLLAALDRLGMTVEP